VDQHSRFGHYSPFIWLEGKRDSKVISDHGLQYSDPIVALLTDRDDAPAKQTTSDLGQAGPNVVEPANNPRPSCHRELALGCGGQYTGALEFLFHRAQILGPDLDISIKVDAREPMRRSITCRQSVRLGGGPNVQNPHGRAKGSSDCNRVISTPVGDNDDVKLAGVRRSHQPTKEPTKNPALVVCGDDNADHGASI
jgi:hypothetical protein